ncbi:unnamed protein product, partial [Prorocentrum cordatum]
VLGSPVGADRSVFLCAVELCQTAVSKLAPSLSGLDINMGLGKVFPTLMERSSMSGVIDVKVGVAGDKLVRELAQHPKVGCEAVTKMVITSISRSEMPMRSVVLLRTLLSEHGLRLCAQRDVVSLMLSAVGSHLERTKGGRAAGARRAGVPGGGVAETAADPGTGDLQPVLLGHSQLLHAGGRDGAPKAAAGGPPGGPQGGPDAGRHRRGGPRGPSRRLWHPGRVARSLAEAVVVGRGDGRQRPPPEAGQGRRAGRQPAGPARRSSAGRRRQRKPQAASGERRVRRLEGPVHGVRQRDAVSLAADGAQPPHHRQHGLRGGGRPGRQRRRVLRGLHRGLAGRLPETPRPRATCSTAATH